MRNNSLFIFILLLVASVVAGCRVKGRPNPPVVAPDEYELAYVESFGRFYDSVPLNVFGLDLYGGDLYLDSTYHMVGTGWNLYLSDIFLAEKQLMPGDYHSDPDPKAYTFLPGMDFEGMPHGSYLLQIENAGIVDIRVFEEGCMHVEQIGDTMDVSIYFTQKQDTIYRAHFRGVLIKK